MLRHKKQPTPQELYWARKRREDEERDANLPPGLINHGNTCFMNSTLQGLIATPLLHSLVNFEDVSTTSSTIAARRSPQLTNGHGHGGPYEHEREQGMPLGDVFVSVLQKAWGIQQSHKRESMSPKELLTTIGQKYDQYLDFRQQDAHEFLSHMLDAMRMEELDIIKKRQPPPTKHKRRQSRKHIAGRNAPGHPSSDSAHPNGHPDAVLPGEEKLVPFVDMLFGGKLASILVCSACNKISITYEDFNDLSLSIKPEDYIKERKRDRFKSLAKKLRFRPKELSTTDGVRVQRSSSVPASPVRRSMEPPTEETDPPVNVDHRRRSFDQSPADGGEEEHEAADAVAALAGDTSIDKTLPAEPVIKVEVELNEEKDTEDDSQPAGHVSFADPSRNKGSDGEKKDVGWGRLGRRISMSVTKGMTKKDKRLSRSMDGRASRANHARDSEGSRAPSEERLPTGSSTPRIPLPESVHNSPDVAHLSDASRSRAASPAPPPTPSPALSPSLNIIGAFPNIRRNSALSFTDRRPKEPRAASPSREESEYLRCILADVHPSSSGTFSMFHQALSGGSSSGASQSTPVLSAQTLLAKLGHLPGIDECLRLFTAVEVMDGENMVGCHRCWKMTNGTYKPKHRPADPCSDEDSEEGSQDSPIIINSGDVPRPEMLRQETADSSAGLREYISSGSDTLILRSAASSSLFLHENASVSSAPTTMQSTAPSAKPLPTPIVTELAQTAALPAITTPEVLVASYGGLPIPVISTTAPDTPTPASETTEPPAIESDEVLNTLKDTLLPPRGTKRRTRKNLDMDDSSIDSDDEGYDSASDASAEGSIYSDASSLASPSVSPSTSPRASMENLPLSAQTSLPTSGSDRHPSGKKDNRSEQVILRRTYKRYLIATPPPILVIHLKRFQQISKSNPYAMAFSGGFKKLDDFVAFPEYLDLGPYLAPKKEDFGLGKKSKKEKAGKKEPGCMYRLYAVVVHIGNMLGGHYIAYTAIPPQTPSSQSSSNTASSSSDESPPRQWAYISDTVVRLTTLEEVLKAKAYICMYERIL